MRFRRLTLRKKTVLAAALLAAVVGVIVYRAVARGHFFGDGNLDVVVETEVVFRKVPGIVPNSVRFSDDGRRYAYTVKIDKKARVVVDGVEGPEYDEAGYWQEIRGGAGTTVGVQDTLTAQIRFSPGGKRVAYIAKREGRLCVVVDGIEGPWYDNVGFVLGGWGNAYAGYYLREVLLSGDAGHYLYAAERGGKPFIVTDGVEGPEFDEIDIRSITSSADGKRFGYAARRGEKWFFVVDAREYGGHDEISPPRTRFSEDSPHFAYVARDGEKWGVVLDGKVQGTYDTVGRPTFAKNGGTLTYEVNVGGRHFFVSNGVEGPRFDGLSVLEHAPDGAPTVYAFQKESQWFLRADGVETAIDAVPTRFVRSPDGKRSAWIASHCDPQFVVVDGRKGRLYEAVDHGSFRFSPDGSRFAYVAQRKGRRYAVVDGVERGPYEKAEPPQFTPDGRHVFYQALVSNRRFVSFIERLRDAVRLHVPRLREHETAIVVIDGSVAGRYDAISWDNGVSCFGLTPDGRHLAYIAQTNGREYVFVDGVRKAECPLIDRSRSKSSSWDPLWYLVEEGDDKYVRVTVRLVEK